MAVRLLKECIAGYKGYEHLVEPATELDTFRLEVHSTGTEEYLISCVKRLATGEPLQYALGYEWFCGHRFNVAPGVLIPRPETEELVREAIGIAEQVQVMAQEASVSGGQRSLSILDICTGSGCIAWSLAAAIPQAAVCACDISPVALQIAGSQNIFNPDGTPAQARFFECDILSPQAEQTILSRCADVPATVGAGGILDLIVSNPPYVCDSEKLQMRPNVLEHEPHLALFVPDEDPLMFYRAIAQLSGRLLKSGGALMFEINERFGQETKKILQDLGFGNCRVVQDIFGKDRMVLGYKNFS
jgi:release factor glutamine methyltransferase